MAMSMPPQRKRKSSPVIIVSNDVVKPNFMIKLSDELLTPALSFLYLVVSSMPSVLLGVRFHDVCYVGGWDYLRQVPGAHCEAIWLRIARAKNENAWSKRVNAGRVEHCI